MLAICISSYFEKYEKPEVIDIPPEELITITLFLSSTNSSGYMYVQVFVSNVIVCYSWFSYIDSELQTDKTTKIIYKL